MESLNSKPLALSSVAGPITRRRKALLSRGAQARDIEDTAGSNQAHQTQPQRKVGWSGRGAGGGLLPKPSPRFCSHGMWAVALMMCTSRIRAGQGQAAPFFAPVACSKPAWPLAPAPTRATPPPSPTRSARAAAARPATATMTSPCSSAGTTSTAAPA